MKTKDVRRQQNALSVVYNVVQSVNKSVVFPVDNIAYSVNRSVVIAGYNVSGPFDYPVVMPFQDIVHPANSAVIVANNPIAAAVYTFIRSARKADNAAADIVNGGIYYRNHGNDGDNRNDRNASPYRSGNAATYAGSGLARTADRTAPG